MKKVVIIDFNLIFNSLLYCLVCALIVYPFYVVGLNIVARYCLFEITGVYVVFLGIVSTILCGIAACVLEKRFSTSTLHILFFGILFYLLLFYIGYELQLFLEKEIYEFNRTGDSLPFYWVFIPEFLLYEITALIAFFGRLIYLIRKLRT